MRVVESIIGTVLERALADVDWRSTESADILQLALS